MSRAIRSLAFAAALLLAAPAAVALDVDALWNFGEPAQSEQRFRAALATAHGDDAFVLETQIARTYGLRERFADARKRLRALAPHLSEAGPEARARYWLELGRTYASATHPAKSQTVDARQRARKDYLRAYAYAKAAGADALAIDALHMLAFVDTAPADQLRWGELALDAALSSPQAHARAWEASLRNNVGYALLQLGRNEEALALFEAALALREQRDDAEATWVARWMVARALRAMGRLDEALQIQHRIEHERDAAHAPDPEVFEELALLHAAKGELRRAHMYALRAHGERVPKRSGPSAPAAK
jgi:tetratricopeptide (TPR) repeat protein